MRYARIQSNSLIMAPHSGPQLLRSGLANASPTPPQVREYLFGDTKPA